MLDLYCYHLRFNYTGPWTHIGEQPVRDEEEKHSPIRSNAMGLVLAESSDEAASYILANFVDLYNARNPTGSRVEAVSSTAYRIDLPAIQDYLTTHDCTVPHVLFTEDGSTTL